MDVLLFAVLYFARRYLSLFVQLKRAEDENKKKVNWKSERERGMHQEYAV